MLNQVTTQCCAVMEIAELSSHRGPEEAMKALVKQCIHKSPWSASTRFHIPAFFTFTGVVKCVCQSDDSDDCDDHVDYVTYGPAFADYIKEHSLGSVRESVGRLNLQNHPTHMVKVWVWGTDVDEIKLWWKHHGG